MFRNDKTLGLDEHQNEFGGPCSKAVHSLDCFEDIENRSLEMQSILRMTHNNQFQ